MAYSLEVIRRARQRLAEAKEEKESLTREKLQTVYSRLPRVKMIDIELRKSMVLAAQSVFQQTEEAKTAMEDAKKANLLLQQERKNLIEQCFGADYLDESPVCSHCQGVGYIGTRMCSCLQELCRQEQKKELSLLACGEGDFSQFRLDYYPSQVDSRYGASPRAIMEQNLKLCRRFAENFGKGNLLFIGGTGLGKTFLSACVAREVADRGYSVAYESAGHLFLKLEKNRFSPDEESEAAVQRLQNSDLLIIDDLGTELPGNFVTASLYNLVNDRLLSGKPMVISTNLNIDEIARRYSPQIASRLQGSFQRLTFVGDDIRILKSKGITF